MRILILNNDIITRQAAKALSENGHQVTLSGSPETYTLSPEDLQVLLDKCAPDFCLTRNRRIFDRGFNPHGLEVDMFVANNRVPLVCWFTENPLAAGTLDSTNYFYLRHSENCLILCFSPESAMRLKALGHKAGYLPLAATPEWFQPNKRNPDLYGVSFVGRPKVSIPPGWAKNGLADLVHRSLWAKEQMTLQSFQREVIPRVGICLLQDLEKDSTLELRSLQGLFENFALHVQLFLYNQLNIHFMVEAGRLNMLKTLRWLLEAGVQVQLFGGDEWGKIFPSLGETPFVPFEQQASVYTSSKINLVLSKLELGDVVHERIFNIGACSGFALAEHRDAITDLFPEGEVPTFKDREELLEKVEVYLHSHNKRLEISQALHEKVMKEHTFQVRMEQMLEKVRGFLMEKLDQGLETESLEKGFLQ